MLLAPKSRSKKPYRRTVEYSARPSAEKDQFNIRVTEMARQVLDREEKECSKVILALDSKPLRSSRAMVLGGVPAGAIHVAEHNTSTFIAQQRLIATDSDFKGVHHSNADVFSVLAATHKVLVLDLISDYVSDENLARLSHWSEGQQGRHALMLTLGAQSNRAGTIRERTANIAECLPHMHLHFVYPYKAHAGGQSMFVLKFGSWSTGEIQYRPQKVLRQGVDESGVKLFRVKWWGDSAENATWETADSSALAVLRQDGRWPARRRSGSRS